MRFKALLKRLFDKIVQDALPAGLASMLGGLLLTYLPIGHVAQPDHREGYSSLAADDAALAGRARLDCGFRQGTGRDREKPRRRRSGAAARRVRSCRRRRQPRRRCRPCRTRTLLPRRRHRSLRRCATKIRWSPTATPAPAAPASAPDTAAPPAARTDDSLLAKTIGIKDRVVSATQHAVSATFGAIPSWFGSLGDRMGGEGQSPRPPADLVSASWSLSGAADR